MNEFNITQLSSLQSTGIMMIVLTYFGYTFREIPSRLWYLIRQYIVYTIQVETSRGEHVFDVSIEWLVERYPIFKKHILCLGYSLSKLQIADGGYYVIDKKNMCILIVHKTKIKNLQSVEYEVTINIIGFGKDAILDDYNTYIEDKLPKKDKILILETSSDSPDIIVPKRDFSTIYNRNMISIKNTLEVFKDSKELYEKMGIVHKIGFLLYGPPGTGKSSIARAIASYMGYKIRYINNKSSYYSIFNIPSKTVVLLEDLDCIFGSESRKENNQNEQQKVVGNNLDTHDLLNLLDGVITPQDVIFVATTNYIDRIDPALKRSGRFDYVMHIGHLSKRDIRNFCRDFNIDTEKVLEDLKDKLPITGASLQQYMIENYLYNKIDNVSYKNTRPLLSLLTDGNKIYGVANK